MRLEASIKCIDGATAGRGGTSQHWGHPFSSTHGGIEPRRPAIEAADVTNFMNSSSRRNMIIPEEQRSGEPAGTDASSSVRVNRPLLERLVLNARGDVRKK